MPIDYYQSFTEAMRGDRMDVIFVLEDENIPSAEFARLLVEEINRLFQLGDRQLISSIRIDDVECYRNAS